MARFDSLNAQIDNGAIRVHFELDTPCVIGWQIFDPETGAFLFEGEWREIDAKKCDLRVILPQDDGFYRIHVAPVEDRDRFVLIDARVEGGALEMSAPRVSSTGALRAAHFARSLPRVVTLPPRSVWKNRK